jgi:outer membrane protein OmpA-like peptidoglycan-associated protein
MSNLATLKYGIACSVIAAGLALPAGFAFAAEPVSADSIIKALTPKRSATRSLSISPADQTREAETKKFVDTLRNRPSRSLSSSEREQIVAIAQDKPRIDLEIRFDFNSANVSRSASSNMDALGKALSDTSFKGSSFVLAGHTDAVGGEDVNQDLSERRADAVKRVLVEKYGVSAENIVVAGYGKTRLKNKSSPTAAENRRVEVVNVVEK